MKYWINTVSKDHLQIGIDEGFTQANHGASYNLKKINNGDYVAFYSPKTNYKDGKPFQKFTAIGICTDEEPYQIQMTEDFHPWRRKINYLECEECFIKPLINNLDFIPDKQKWGYPFRRGLFEISEKDFRFIASMMKVNL